MLKLPVGFIEDVVKGVQTVYSLWDSNLRHRDLLCLYEDRISLVNLQRLIIKLVWEGYYLNAYPFSSRLGKKREDLYLSIVFHDKEEGNVHKHIKVRTSCKWIHHRHREVSPTWFRYVIGDSYYSALFRQLLMLIKEPITSIKFNEQVCVLNTEKYEWRFITELWNDNDFVYGAHSWFRVCQIDKRTNKPVRLFIIYRNYASDPIKVHDLSEVLRDSSCSINWLLSSLQYAQWDDKSGRITYREGNKAYLSTLME